MYSTSLTLPGLARRAALVLLAAPSASEGDLRPLQVYRGGYALCPVARRLRAVPEEAKQQRRLQLFDDLHAIVDHALRLPCNQDAVGMPLDGFRFQLTSLLQIAATGDIDMRERVSYARFANEIAVWLVNQADSGFQVASMNRGRSAVAS